MEFTVEVFRDKENRYIASCPKLEIYSYGHTMDKAINRLEKVVAFYMDSARELGVTLEEVCLGNRPRPPRWQEGVSARRQLNRGSLLN